VLGLAEGRERTYRHGDVLGSVHKRRCPLQDPCTERLGARPVPLSVQFRCSLLGRTHSERQVICREEYRVREVEIAVDVFCVQTRVVSGLHDVERS
jgi:hypothetical protein